MQSFAPLFIILFVQYFNCGIIDIFAEFSTKKKLCDALMDAIKHPAFGNLLVELLCIMWLCSAVLGIRKFLNTESANFVSQGESIQEVNKISDSGVTFFMTYVLPMTMENINELQGFIVFFILMIILFVLMWKTNLYYQNPILTILGYEVFTFHFETTQMTDFQNRECIGITRGKIPVENRSIKRQYISDNVFIIYTEKADAH